MSDEPLRAACEEFARRNCNCDVTQPKGYECVRCKARAALAAAGPADDREPVSKNWIRGLAGSVSINPFYADCWYADFTIEKTDEHRLWLRLHSPHSEGECPVDVFSKEEDGEQKGIGLVRSWPKTRGDVRRLCATLGVPLTEEGGR